MKISLKWLSDYVSLGKFSRQPGALAEKLTLRGIETKVFSKQDIGWRGVVVAKIEKIEKHPQADRLSVCTVFDGKDHLQIVCGAQNIAMGDIVPLAKMGSELPGNFKIKQASLRGVDSFGMLCSKKELGLGQDSEGIFILPPGLKLGQPLEKLIDIEDTVLECEIPANRGDLLSHLGIAQEVSSLLGTLCHFPPIPKLSFRGPSKPWRSTADELIFFPSLKLNHQGCERYMAMLIQNIKIGPSPLWLQNRLESVGLRAINNVVDITNFIMMETGQPLHAFDFDQFHQGKIIVRHAQPDEQFVALDDKTYALDPADIVIGTMDRSLALGGIIGGSQSAVSDSTHHILLESACFDQQLIRKTARRLKIQTDSSYRFERGVDIETVATALQRGAQFISEMAHGTIHKKVIDTYPKKKKKRFISLHEDKMEKFLGFKIQPKQIQSTLKSLGFVLKKHGKNQWNVEVPFYRRDVETVADISEEVVRCVGFDKIPNQPLQVAKIPVSTGVADGAALMFELKKYLVSQGFFENIHWSFTSPKKLQFYESHHDAITILNPLGEDFSQMRTVLFPSLIDACIYNFNRGQTSHKSFELRRVYSKNGEALHLSLLLSGQAKLSVWKELARDVDFFDLKGVVDSIFELLSVIAMDENVSRGDLSASSSSLKFLHTGKSSEIFISTHPNVRHSVGFLGALHPEWQRKLGADKEIYIAELNLDLLFKMHREELKFQEFSKYPKVSRDISFIADENLSHVEIIKVIGSVQNPLIQQIVLFDIFRDTAVIGEGKKSVAYRIFLQSFDRTLEDEEIDTLHAEIIKHLQSALNIKMRD
ncbi:MAG: phenylalanine--tRNA ligase subunit beta [Deltaproteobacteria bacterium]|nr:phenylalanine--tRNA ligase subunit beta [Deltaproteobacteria bacterium]